MSYNLVDPTTGDLTRVAGGNIIDDGSVSSSKVWSSKKVSDELNKKVNKTDITTTIDSTSTDTQVPSAKSVYDTTSKFLKTYTSLAELGLTIGSETIEDIVNNMEDRTRLITLIFELDNNTSIYPYPNGILIVEKVNIYRVNLKFCNDISSDIYVSTYHGEKGFTGWQRVCTTTVEDVPITYINTFEDETYVKPANHNLCSYYVVNGICVIKLETACLSTTDSFVQILSGLPKPKEVLYSNAIDRTMNSNSGVRGLFQLVTDGTLRVACNYGDSSVTGTRNFYITFSYPVAES